MIIIIKRLLFLANVNSTCVPVIGMFQLLPKLNFSQAAIECANMSGLLADVASEQRTDALALILAGASVDAALVGMRRTNRSAFHHVNGENNFYLLFSF
jgi:hypothetical protein